MVDKNSFATAGMPDSFERTDEFYSFKQIDPSIHVLVKIDETSYQGGKNGDNHPMSWYLTHLSIALAVSCVLLFGALWLFSKLEDNFAEEI